MSGDPATPPLTLGARSSVGIPSRSFHPSGKFVLPDFVLIQSGTAFRSFITPQQVNIHQHFAKLGNYRKVERRRILTTGPSYFSRSRIMRVQPSSTSVFNFLIEETMILRSRS